ncbi:MAG: DNA repair protein RadC [Chitinophagaceae bacterium]|nr:DNA repair protein RadC [Chitinophagaceae bacterium]MCW5928101.1 DNA repair protein RadC [Chitinophagaceae bacterium]
MLPEKTTIKQWAVDDRPREKLRDKGAEALSHSELIAILLHNGTRNKSALDLAKEVLQLGKNNLHQLGRLTIRDLMKINGVGEAKAITLAAALELGRRRQADMSFETPVVTDSASVARYLQALLRDQSQEMFVVLFLNRANKINHMEVISKGGITGTVADPRVILKKALLEDAVSIILCHNHPSGSLKPSRADENITFKIREAAIYFDITVIDHIIVSAEGYFSFADEGLL